MRYYLIAACGLLAACSLLWNEHAVKRVMIPRSALLAFTISVDEIRSQSGATRVLLRWENISPRTIIIVASGFDGACATPVVEDSSGHRLEPLNIVKIVRPVVPNERLGPGAAVEMAFSNALEECFAIAPGSDTRVRFAYNGAVADENGVNLCAEGDLLISNTLVLE